MKVAFLCGSLEAGRDGVGDYVRELAVEMTKQGNQCFLLSLNDKFVQEVQPGFLKVGESTISILRLPATEESKRNDWAFAKQWLAKADPDLLSLQYVIYSFHSKGLPFKLAGRLAQLGNGKRWHIMFHEIWIGFTRISTPKHKFYGLFQQRIISKMVQTLKPGLITTSNGLYQAVLAKKHLTAAVLPLFSNIPLTFADEQSRDSLLQLLSISPKTRAQWKLAGIFGNLYPEAKLEGEVSRQFETVQAEGKRLAVVGIGRMNAAGRAEFDRLSKLFVNRVKFFHFGEQPADRVSVLFQELDFGISCTPAQHIGKSGVYAAMRFHGLPVRLPSVDVIPEYEEVVNQYNAMLTERSPEAWSVSTVSKQFLNLLNSN